MSRRVWILAMLTCALACGDAVDDGGGRESDSGGAGAEGTTVSCDAPRLFGHRGTVLFAPENTLPAYHYAIDNGGDGIEIDLQLTRDGHLVALHDRTLGRTTDGSGDVREIDLQDLEALDGGGWFDPAFVGARVPSLERVIDEFPAEDVALLFDLKEADLVEPLTRTIEDHELHSRSIVSSPDLEILRALSERVPDVPALYYPRSLDELAELDLASVQYVRVPKAIEADPRHVATVRDAGFEAAISGSLIQWQSPETHFTALGLVNNMARTAQRRTDRRPETCASR